MIVYPTTIRSDVEVGVEDRISMEAHDGDTTGSALDNSVEVVGRDVEVVQDANRMA